jgi:hypothetical protein
VHSDGEISFQFKEMKSEDIPSQVVDRYGSKQVQSCFNENKSTFVPTGPDCSGN